MSDRTDYKCLQCNKIYSSYKSRWLHIKKYHTIISANNTPNPPELPPNTAKKAEIKCEYCNKIFTRKDSLVKHKKLNRCQNNKLENKNPDEINKLKKENEEIKKEMQKLKEMLQKSLKIHPKTLQKINNQLNNNNNGTINNYYLQVGNENLDKLMSAKEKKNILNYSGNCINELIKKVHILPIEKYKKCKNVYITNLQNNIGYMYDDNKNKFVAVKKDDLLKKLIDCRLFDIESFMQDHRDELEPHIIKNLEKFLEKIDTDDEMIKLKSDQIKLMLYNSKDDILEQIKEEDIEL